MMNVIPGITPSTTLAEIAASEQMQRELAEIIMGNGARAALSSRRVDYDTADEVASGVGRGVANGLERLAELYANQPGQLRFEITVRVATQEELESTGTTDHASTTDGAAVVLLGGKIVAVTNEYGTAHVVADDLVIDGTVRLPGPAGQEVQWPTIEQIEVMVELATNLWTSGVAGS